MDKIFHSTFDFFSHALPGACIAGAYYLIAHKDIDSVTDLFAKAKEAEIGTGIFLLLGGYVIGLGIYPIGRWLYKWIGKTKIENEIKWDPNGIKEKQDKNYLQISDKFILIRELSPANFKYVETWNMFCAMCHNLSIACILIFLMMLGELDLSSWGNFFHSNDFRFLIMAFMLVLAGLFIDRAITFSIWAANDLNAAINKLNLVERAKHLPEQEEPLVGNK